MFPNVTEFEPVDTAAAASPASSPTPLAPVGQVPRAATKSGHGNTLAAANGRRVDPAATGTRGTHAERGRSTRARAFAAAIECLHERGYAGASIVAVTKRAGLSRGALNKQFLTKADLYAALMEQLLDEMREDTLAYVRTFPPGLPRAMARIDSLWNLYKEPRAFAFLEIMLGSRADAELCERLERVGESRNLIEKQLLSLDFDDMGIVDRRAAGLAGIQMLATVRGLALERLLNKNDDLLDAAFARQRRQLEDSYRALMPD